MRLAALYDIHGNLPALEAVLQAVAKADVDQVLVGGDVVLGPMSGECLDRLASLTVPLQFIKGNCEVAVLQQTEGKLTNRLPDSVLEDIRWTAQNLSPEQVKMMADWPFQIKMEVRGLGNLLFCHATPRDVNENFTPLSSSERLTAIFDKVESDIVICGHTHMQFELRTGHHRVVNAGSVGMPFGKPGAYWLLIGDDIEFCHTPYDLEAAARRIKQTDYPHKIEFAENNILNPPSEEFMAKTLKA